MKTILGLDLGVNSLGWAIIVPDEQKILDAGVRIFPAGINEKTIGQGERELSKNAERREHRMMRRMLFRKKLRKIKLLELLSEEGMCPLTPEELKRLKKGDQMENIQHTGSSFSPAFLEWLRLNPYELRYRAIHGTITLEELGRILYHMIQRRGFQTSRKGESKEKGTIFEGERGILDLKAKMGNRTLGEYLYLISHKEGDPYNLEKERTVGYRLRNRYTLREMYVEEFDRIWEKQAGHLGLKERQKKVTRTRFMKGKPGSKRNREKIEALKRKYGENNVMVKEHWIITQEVLPLKELIAGKIRYENGRIKYESNRSVLFWQRPLRSQRSLLGECRYEKTITDKNSHYLFKGRKPCPISHPDYEMFRAWQFVNNIKYGNNRPLTPQQKEEVIELLNKKEKVKFKEIPKMLGLTYEKFNYDDDFPVTGNPTIRKIRPLFPEKVWEERKYDIWQCFYFYENNELLFEKLKQDYHLKTDDPEKISKIHLNEGYGNLSLKAIRNILPFLEKGYPYSHAVILGGVKNVFGERWEYFREYHEEIEKNILSIIYSGNNEGEMIQRIKEFLGDPANRFGFEKDDKKFLRLYHPSQEVIKKEKKKKLEPVENLRNPIVQQGLNEMRRLINTLLEELRAKYGKDFEFDEIHVEFARELKIGKEQRAEMTRRIRENEEKNKTARERILEYGLRPSRDNIQKYLLYREIEDRAGKVQCPYTGMTISIYDLLGPENRIQIEHIIPYSISLDDSFANKTLCESNFNREKGELTPYGFYQKAPDPALWGADSWEEVEQRAFRLLPYAKAKRFVTRRDMGDEKIREGFIQRQLNDTRYISKKAASILTEICDDVRVMPGSVTAELRHLWGLNTLLSETTLPLQELDDIPEIPELHRVVIDRNGKPVKAIKVKNEKPSSSLDELVLPGECINGRFMFGTKDPLQEVPAPGVTNGKCWMKTRVKELAGMYPVYREKPPADEDHVILSGMITKKRFLNESLKKSVPAGMPDGKYWGRFRVLAKAFSAGNQKPVIRGNKPSLLLFGQVKNGTFHSYIFKTSAPAQEGPAWLLLEIDTENVEYTRQQNDPPPVTTEQVLLEGVVNRAGTFVPDLDKDFSIDTEAGEGKHRALFRIDTANTNFYPMETPLPQTGKGEKIVEGDLWVDKNTGDIRFDPKKSRDDHRHHAIDAITIALTTRSHLLKLSTYNAGRKAKERGQADKPRFDPPWPDLYKDVKKAADGILVSFRRNNRVLTRISKRFKKDGRTLTGKGTAARGQLHRETFFGKRRAVNMDQHSYHVRKEITAIENHKHVGKIVDDAIRKLIEKKLQENGIDTSRPYKIPPGFFFDDLKRPKLFLPNRNGDPVPIKKVRMRENIGNAVPLKKSFNIWVNPYNNHHVMIYKDRDGNLKEDIVTFWEAVRRIQNKESLYRMPPDGTEMVATLQENDMFLLGYPGKPEEIAKGSPAELSPYLYRVQKISSMYYTFRHHRAANLDDDFTEISIRSFNSWQTFHPFKVRITETGRIAPEKK